MSMNLINQAIFVNRPLEEAFDYCTNPEFFDRWMPGVISSKQGTSGPLYRGATLTQDIMIGNKVERATGQVCAFEPNQKWSYTLRGAGFWVRRTWSFELLSKGTKIHYTEELSRETGFFAPMAKLFTKAPQADVLRGLKRDLESTSHYLPDLV